MDNLTVPLAAACRSQKIYFFPLNRHKGIQTYGSTNRSEASMGIHILAGLLWLRNLPVVTHAVAYREDSNSPVTIIRY